MSRYGKLQDYQSHNKSICHAGQSQGKENYKITNHTIKVYATPVKVKVWKITRLSITQLKNMPRQSKSSHWKEKED